MTDSSSVPENKPDHVLSYLTPLSGKIVTLTAVSSEAAAALIADALSDGGIRSLIINSHTNSLGVPYSGFAAIKVQVQEHDAEAAKQIVSALGRFADDLEPAENTSPVALDASGMEVETQVAEAFAHARLLFDAAAALEAAHIPHFMPNLVPRGARPVGTGNRFLLRVGPDDLPRARAILREVEADEKEEPHCPRCYSWRVIEASDWMSNLLRLISFRPILGPHLECTQCGHRWPAP